MDNLYPSHFLKLLDLDQGDIYALLSLAQRLKENKQLGYEKSLLAGCHFALIYEDVIIQQRHAFDVAARDLGAQVTHIGLHHHVNGVKPDFSEAQIAALTQDFDGILYYGAHHETLKALAQHAKCVVWNGLTEVDSMVDVLANLLVIQVNQHADALQGVKLAYLGDARGNLPTSLLESAAILGIDIRIIGSKAFWPNKKLVDTCMEIGKRNRAEITLTDDVVRGVHGVDYIYMNIWAPMINPTEVWHKIVALLPPNQIMQNLMELTENQDVNFLHELPCVYNANTTMELGKMTRQELIQREKITIEVLESNPSCALVQVESQIHILKAIMLTSLGKIT